MRRPRDEACLADGPRSGKDKGRGGLVLEQRRERPAALAELEGAPSAQGVQQPVEHGTPARLGDREPALRGRAEVCRKGAALRVLRDEGTGAPVPLACYEANDDALQLEALLVPACHQPPLRPNRRGQAPVIRKKKTDPVIQHGFLDANVGRRKGTGGCTRHRAAAREQLAGATSTWQSSFRPRARRAVARCPTLHRPISRV